MTQRRGCSAYSVSRLNALQQRILCKSGCILTLIYVQSDGMGGASYSSSCSSHSNESGSRWYESELSTCRVPDSVDDSRLKRPLGSPPWCLRSSSRSLDVGEVASVPLDSGRTEVSMGEAPADAWPSINADSSVARSS